jgi:transcriptional regulator Rrf2-like protein
MDQAGIEKAILISYGAEDVATEIRNRGHSPLGLKPVISLRYQFESWRAHQDRFWWFPDSIRPIRDGYLEDLDHNFEQGASGIKLLLPFLPAPHMSKVLQYFARTGLLRSAKGPQGGFALDIDPAQIRLMDIVAPLDGLVKYRRCATGLG